MILLKICTAAFCLAIIFWTAGAVYYDVGQRSWWGSLLSIGWIVGAVLIIIFVKPIGLATLIITIVFLIVLAWWLTQKPSHDRNWDQNFSKLPQLMLSDDQLTVINVRNSNYRSLEDYDCRYETRTYQMSSLKAADVLILYWGSNWMCHPMAIFDFGDDQHLCFSIEVRYREGEPYDIIRSMYRQNELMYVVCDERDAILRRTKYSVGHECYLYRLQTGVEHARQLLSEYIESTNAIVDQPRWYNAVTENCTTSIYWQRREKPPWDWRMLFNGTFDKMLYDRGRLFRELPFNELKQKSLINTVANGASEENFSREIRAGLPGF